jgi:hypothetical protein
MFSLNFRGLKILQKMYSEIRHQKFDTKNTRERRTIVVDPEPDQFADDKPYVPVWNRSLFEHFFNSLGLYLEARI